MSGVAYLAASVSFGILATAGVYLIYWLFTHRLSGRRKEPKSLKVQDMRGEILFVGGVIVSLMLYVGYFMIPVLTADRYSDRTADVNGIRAFVLPVVIMVAVFYAINSMRRPRD